jgi:hypothetical protein
MTAEPSTEELLLMAVSDNLFSQVLSARIFLRFAQGLLVILEQRNN